MARLLLVGVSVVVVALVGGFVLVGGGTDSASDDSGAADPTTTSSVPDLGFPDASSDVAAGDLTYLAGDGRALLIVHEHGKDFVSEQRTVDRCRDEAQALDEAVSADEALSLVGGISDPVLRAAFNAERTALGIMLTRCISGDTATDDAELGQAVEAVDVRLQELEASR